MGFLRQFALKLLPWNFCTLKWSPHTPNSYYRPVACGINSKRICNICPGVFYDLAFLFLTCWVPTNPAFHVWSSSHIQSSDILEDQHIFFAPLANSYVSIKTLLKYHSLQEPSLQLPVEASWPVSFPPWHPGHTSIMADTHTRLYSCLLPSEQWAPRVRAPCSFLLCMHRA